MSQIYNIYCDESSHLENDHQKVMVLGAVWCPLDKAREISTRIREIKARHSLKSGFELKWTKVSPPQLQFYLDIIDYFFDTAGLHSRALVIPDKTLLKHGSFNQTHDTWYYKMYFNLIKVIFNPEDVYNIYIDIKDSRGGAKIYKLQEILRHSVYDFTGSIIKKLQIVRSHEIEIMQITDLLIGAVGYANKGLVTSEAKKILIQRIRERSGYALTRSTLYRENKLNIFKWEPAEIQ